MIILLVFAFFVNNAFSSKELPFGVMDKKYGLSTWLWQDVTKLSDEDLRSRIDFCKHEGIDTIYLSIDQYEAIFYGRESEEIFDRKLKLFIKEAKTENISVHALIGSPNYTLKDNRNLMLGFVDFVFNFNSKNPEVAFDGISLDLEYYAQKEYSNDKTDRTIEFLNLSDEIISKVVDYQVLNKDFELSFAVPFWFNSKTNLNIEVGFKNKKAYPLEHLLDLLDSVPNSKLLIMSYRNFVNGNNGTLDIASRIIGFIENNNYKTKVYIGQETGDVAEKKVSYFGKSKSDLYNALEELSTKLYDRPSVEGFAIHDLKGFMELKD